jgi:uridine kinase/Gpi18-like mannosyltransferase
MMLWIMSVPQSVVSFFLNTSSDFNLFDSLIFRIPILIADIIILAVLIRWLKNQIRQVLLWYWLSPILFYINYIHGQLDVIPISFLFISLYFIFKSKHNLSFLFLSIAVACKTNMVLVFPFLLIYLYNNVNSDWKKIVKPISVFSLTILLVNYPFLNSYGFIKMVYNNPVQQQVFDLYYNFNNSLKIYFIPSVYFSLVIWYLSMKFVNRDQLILFLAFTFLSLTIMIAPMQGWYYWIIPFLIYFAVKQNQAVRKLLILLTFLYFTYFGLIPNSDYFNSFNLSSSYSSISFLINHNQKILDIVFTLLQTTLLIFTFIVFKKGIYNNIQKKFLSQPYLIGIGGDSAAGKSTLSNALLSVFEPSNTGIIRGDDMHKWERLDDNWKKYTHLDPRANNIHQDMSHVLSLKTGNKIKRSFYDHNTGKFKLPEFIKPNKLIIFEGLHSFYLKNQADIYDLKVFMEPEENLRIWWKVQRDVRKRGYSPEKVLEQLKRREEDAIKYIRAQANNADIIATFYSKTSLDFNNANTNPTLGLKIILPNYINLDLLLEQLYKVKSLFIKHNYNEDKHELIFEGLIESSIIEIIAGKILPELDEVGIYNAEWKDNYEGVMQLLIVYVVFHKLIQN